MIFKTKKLISEQIVKYYRFYLSLYPHRLHWILIKFLSPTYIINGTQNSV
jgi:hypothetical protein